MFSTELENYTLDTVFNSAIDDRYTKGEVDTFLAAKSGTLSGVGNIIRSGSEISLNMSAPWNFTNGTESISSGTGAVVFSGGVSILKKLRVDGIIYQSGSLPVATQDWVGSQLAGKQNSLIMGSGLSISGNTISLNTASPITFSSNFDPIENSGLASITVNGGIKVLKNVQISGDIECVNVTVEKTKIGDWDLYQNEYGELIFKNQLTHKTVSFAPNTDISCSYFADNQGGGSGYFISYI